MRGSPWYYGANVKCESAENLLYTHQEAPSQPCRCQKVGSCPPAAAMCSETSVSCSVPLMVKPKPKDGDNIMSCPLCHISAEV